MFTEFCKNSKIVSSEFSMTKNTAAPLAWFSSLSIKFLTSTLESSLCDYSDAYVMVTGNIAVVGADNNTKVAFKNYAPF